MEITIPRSFPEISFLASFEEIMAKTFGEVFRYHKEILGLSLTDIRNQLEINGYEIYSNGTISKWQTGKMKPKSEIIEVLEDILQLERGVLLKAAGYMIEGHTSGDKTPEGKRQFQDPVVNKMREDHFSKLAEMLERLLGDLDTIKIDNNVGKVDTEDQDKQKYLIGKIGQENVITNDELDDIIDANTKSVQEYYDVFLWDCLVSHLEADKLAAIEYSSEGSRKRDSYRRVERWRILAHRKTFKGSCPICQSWNISE